MTSAQRTPLEDLLVGGLDDWADAGWVLQSARLSGESDPIALRELTLSLIADVLRGKLMVAGDIVDGQHVPWRIGAEEAIDLIAGRWRGEWGAGVPTPGAIVWLANTTAGDELARTVLSREGA